MQPLLRRPALVVLFITMMVLSTVGSWGAGYLPPVRAFITDNGGNFGSAVPCLESPDQFATTCFANTIVEDTSASGETLRRVASSDTALVRFNTQGKSPLANLGQLGSVYGLAYDDGAASGTRQLFIAAFAKRLTSYGPGGPGAIYSYNLTTGAVTTFAQVPGTTNRHVTSDPNDEQMAAWVGKSSLGDMELGPGGRTLFALNLDTRQIERYAVPDGARNTPLTINFGLISADPAVQANLRPFALEFQPGGDPARPQLHIGVIDSGERNPNGVIPTAYVMVLDIATGNQGIVVTQPLNIPEIYGRFEDGVNAGAPGWRSWINIGRAALWPMPIVSDIQFSRDGGTMFVGLRDRNGDVFSEDTGDNAWWRVQAQGDVLAYRWTGGWTLQQRGSVPTQTDFFRDNYVGGPSTAHVENSMGALATTLAGPTNSGLTEYALTTAITPLTGGTAGVNWYASAPDAYDRAAAVELIPEGDVWKSATLGDLENLCAVAYIGDRVWQDANGNGVQDAGEPGMGGVRVVLQDDAGTTVATATTDGNGIYQFALPPNTPGYRVVLDPANFAAGQPLAGWIMSPRDRGGNDAADSDADEIQRTIALPAQPRDAYNMTYDFGLMQATFANGEVGDFVWNDRNGNGVQDAGEPGVGNVPVNLIDTATNTVVATTTTSAGGLYRFRNVVPGTYVVEFVPPAGIDAAPRDAGNDAADSDADAATAWRTGQITVVADVVNTTLDLGLLMTTNVSVTKSGPASVVVGSQMTYTIAYRNNGPAAAQNVQVTDTLPAGTTFVSASPAPTATSGQTLTWNIGRMASGATGSISVVVAVAVDAPTSVTNRADMTTTTEDTTPSDNTSTTTTQVTRPDVQVTKTGPAEARVGANVTYTLAYRNTGTAPATSVTVIDTLPAGMTFVSANPAPTSVTGQTVTWSLGTLAPNATGSISVVARAPIDGLSGQDLTNQGSISTSTPGDDPSNNTSTTTTTLRQPDLSITKADGQTTAQPGDTLTYQITVRNVGDSVANGIVVREQPPSWATLPPSAEWSAQPDGSYTQTISSLAPNAFVTLTFRIVVPSPLDTAITDITNTVTVRDDGSAGADPTPGNNTSTDIDQPITASIGDRVWNDTNGDGVQDAGEPGMSNMTVDLMDANGQVIGTTSTNSEGLYTFTGLRMGTYRVALPPTTTTSGIYSDYRYTTSPTPSGDVTPSNRINLTFDIGLTPPVPTAVALSYFRVERDGVIRWGTLSEQETRAFRVERTSSRIYTNPVVIGVVESKSSRGADYQVRDQARPTAPGITYWLIEIELDGTEHLYGPAALPAQQTLSLIYLPTVLR